MKHRRRGLLRSAPRGIAMDRRSGAARSEDPDAARPARVCPPADPAPFPRGRDEGNVPFHAGSHRSADVGAAREPCRCAGGTAQPGEDPHSGTSSSWDEMKASVPFRAGSQRSAHVGAAPETRGCAGGTAQRSLAKRGCPGDPPAANEVSCKAGRGR